MRRKILLVIGLCLVFATGGYSQTKAKKTDLNEKLKLNGTVRYGKLDNGLTYFIKANKKPENRAEFFLAVNAGSVLEEINEIGLAHFTEHMNFNGTRQFPYNSLIDQLEKKGIVFGADINAYTSFDETVYNLQLPIEDTNMIETGLKVLDGWAGGSLMTDKEIDDERGVIIEEWRMNQSGNRRLSEECYKVWCKGSKYAERIPIGTLQWLQNFKYSDIRGFYKKWYRPDNMAVIIVGDFDADAMEQKVKDFFTMSDKPCAPLDRPIIHIPDNQEPLIGVFTDKEATSTNIQVMWKHPSTDIANVGDFREYLKRDLFEQMIQARLNEIGQKKVCPYMNAFGGYGDFLARDLDAYYTGGTAKEGKALQAFETILLENQRALQNGFLPTELERAKDEVLSNYDKAAKEESKTENTPIARELVAYFLENKPFMGAKVENKYAKEFVEGITLEEVNSLIKEWITDKNMIVTITMPEKKGVKVPTEKDILKVLDKIKKEKTSPWIDNTKTEPFLANEPKGGKVKETIKNDKFGYTEYKLSNGATVIIKPTTFKNDQILLSAQSAGGESLYEDKDIMNANFAATIVEGSGVGTYDDTQLQKFMKGKNFNASVSIGTDKEVISGYASPKDFEYMLQYVYLYFTSPRADKEVLESNIDKLKTQLSQAQNSPEVTFQLDWLKAMYPQDKRTIYLPTEAQLKQLDLNKMLKIFKERFSNAADFTFTFVGNIDEKKDLPLIEKYIGGLPASDKTEKWIDRSTPFSKGVVKKDTYKGKDNKGMMTITFRNNFNWSDKDRVEARLLNNICGIKVTQVIREKMGGTYSPYFSLNYDKYPKSEIAAVILYTCDPAKVDTLTTATFEILDDIINNGPTDEDIAKAKEQLISERKTQMENNNYWTSVINGSRWYGYDLQTYDEYVAAVNAITKDDLKAAAAKYLNHKEYLRCALKPEAMKPAK
ncbi:MAG: insulinase family protein [Bacteroidales bacterium]|jgi:zinc protease|nr:insulinase family protein [Bacteroidales bacterium]